MRDGWLDNGKAVIPAKAGIHLDFLLGLRSHKIEPDRSVRGDDRDGVVPLAARASVS